MNKNQIINLSQNKDFLIATPPCQGFSTLGLTKRTSNLKDDKRNFLIFDIIEILDQLIIPGGVFVTKIWKGSEEKEIVKILKNKFNDVSYFKPDSSRKDSVEIFVIAKNYKSI